jgi:formylmethanofuran dehydrogenase subunit B
VPEPVIHHDVVCPFCSLLCDDLVVEAADSSSLRVTAKGCTRAAEGFALPSGETVPRIAGKAAGLDQAVAEAAKHLRASRRPLVAGLGTDTDGVRAALLLAEMTGGIVDHLAADGLMANMDAMRSTGWVTGTLAEIRNRADLVLMVGTDGKETAPRLFERCIWPDRAIDAEALARRRVIYVGPEGLDTTLGRRPDGTPPEHLACPADRLLEAVGALRALVGGHRVGAGAVSGIATERLRGLAEALQTARYAVVIWAAGDFEERRADLLTLALAELTKELNLRTRCVGLPLAGLGNVIGANQVCGWQMGLPLRTGFVGGIPIHDPYGFATGRLLASGAVDCLLWVSSLADTPPPAADIPTIALAHSATRFVKEPEVVIPVGTPGLDHEGALYRTDSVVALRARKLRDTGLPAASSALSAIASALKS